MPSPLIRSPPTIIKQSRFSVNAVLGIRGSFSDSDTSSSHSQPDVDNLDSVEASVVFFSYASSSSSASSSSVSSPDSSTVLSSVALDPCPLSSSHPDINLNQDLIAYINNNNCHSSYSSLTVTIPFQQIYKCQLHYFVNITEFVGRNKPSFKKKSSAGLRYFCSSTYPSSAGFTGVHFDALVRDVQKEALKVGLHHS